MKMLHFLPFKLILHPQLLIGMLWVSTFNYILYTNILTNIITSLETGLESSMGFFGLTAGHSDKGDDEAGLTCMISNSRIPDEYEAGRFHIFGSGLYTVVNPRTISIFCGLGKHGGTPPIAPEGVEVLKDATRLMIVLYCPKAALSPSGSSIPFASLPNGTPLLLGPEVTNPLCDSIILLCNFQFIFFFFSMIADLVKRNLQDIVFGHTMLMSSWKRNPI
jgi:hypothetical protein